MLNSKLLGGTAAGKTYIEDVFSTWLYSGSASAQTIYNGIDLSGKGGLVWMKSRSSVANHALIDSDQAWKGWLASNNTNANGAPTSQYLTPESTGFTISLGGAFFNDSGINYSSWTFRKAAKFFDVVTWTTTGNANQRVTHNLGTTPGTIIVKAYSTTGTWYVWHRSLSSATNSYLDLSSTAAAGTIGSLWGSTGPTSTDFGVPQVAAGQTWVAYLFAHDTGTDGLIQCGTSTSGTFNNLGWEPQWVLAKPTSNDNWYTYDNMRGLPVSGTTPYLSPNLSGAEVNGTNNVTVTATGFTQNLGNCVWIAIRRGPMRTPTDATKVFGAQYANQTGAGLYVDVGAPLDFWLAGLRVGGATNAIARARLTDANYLLTSSTAAEAVGSGNNWQSMKGIGTGSVATDTTNYVHYGIRRAPGFFDVVAYTGNDATSRNITHNLGVVPEFIIAKSRTTVTFWETYHKDVGANYSTRLNSSNARLLVNNDKWANTVPTSSVFSVGIDLNYGTVTSGGAAVNYIAYLFASCPGVSKCFNYTGTGTTLQIDCGFTNGARFVLIKRTDSTGDWYVWDTARGIISGNDPYLLLNSTAAEVTNTDYIDPYSAGFEISSTAPAAINANGGSYIGLAIA